MSTTTVSDSETVKKDKVKKSSKKRPVEESDPDNTKSKEPKEPKKKKAASRFYDDNPLHYMDLGLYWKSLQGLEVHESKLRMQLAQAEKKGDLGEEQMNELMDKHRRYDVMIRRREKRRKDTVDHYNQLIEARKAGDTDLVGLLAEPLKKAMVASEKRKKRATEETEDA